MHALVRLVVTLLREKKKGKGFYPPPIVNNKKQLSKQINKLIVNILQEDGMWNVWNVRRKCGQVVIVLDLQKSRIDLVQVPPWLLARFCSRPFLVLILSYAYKYNSQLVLSRQLGF